MRTILVVAGGYAGFYTAWRLEEMPRRVVRSLREPGTGGDLAPPHRRAFVTGGEPVAPPARPLVRLEHAPSA